MLTVSIIVREQLSREPSTALNGFPSFTLKGMPKQYKKDKIDNNDFVFM